jgi:hypothetical protein
LRAKRGNPECQQYQRTLDRRVTSFLAMTELSASLSQLGDIKHQLGNIKQARRLAHSLAQTAQQVEG